MTRILFILLAATAFGQALAPTGIAPAIGWPMPDKYEQGDRIVMLRGKAFDNEMRVWLRLESQTGDDWKTNGYEAKHTRIYSDYPPFIRRLPGGNWEIAFAAYVQPRPSPTPCP